MNKLKRYVFVLGFFASCKSDNLIIVNPPEEGETTDVEEIIASLEDSESDQVLVVAHRGVWDDAPENSLSSIEAAISLGVDMVELDVRRTKDGVLVLMHDETVDRMTDGTGSVVDMTLEEIQQLSLRNRDGGVLTEEGVPTLSEAMQTAKDRIMVRVDKAYSLGILDEVMAVLEETETVDHATMVVSQNVQPGKVAFDWPNEINQVFFTPGVDADGNGGASQAQGYLEYDKVVALESSFSDEDNLVIDWDEIKSSGARVLVYTGNDESCGGHGDAISLTDIDEGYGWLIGKGVNMIQTDQSEYLIDYLRILGLHD